LNNMVRTMGQHYTGSTWHTILLPGGSFKVKNDSVPFFCSFKNDKMIFPLEIIERCDCLWKNRKSYCLAENRRPFAS